MVRKRLMARSGAERFERGYRMIEAGRELVLASRPENLSAPRCGRFFSGASRAKRILRSRAGREGCGTLEVRSGRGKRPFFTQSLLESPERNQDEDAPRTPA